MAAPMFTPPDPLEPAPLIDGKYTDKDINNTLLAHVWRGAGKGWWACFAVALSRVAVGAHWPSDALAGAGLGLLAGVAGARAQQHWAIASTPRARVVLALLVLACAATLARLDLGYPLARPLQLGLATLGGAMAALALWRSWTARRQAPSTPA